MPEDQEREEWSGEKDFDEVYALATSVFPHAQVEVDNDGQWIIYTDIKAL